MKKFISFINYLAISLLTIIIIILIIVKLLTTPKFIQRILKYTSYYEEASVSIKNSVNYIVIEDNLKETIDEVITSKRIENDILLMFSDISLVEENIKRDLNSSFKNKLIETKYEENSLNNLTDRISSIYIKALFPYKDYNTIISKINGLINLNIAIVVSLIVLIALFVSSVFLRNFKTIIVRSNYITIFTLLFVFAFSKLNGLFENFYYINAHFSNIIILIFNIIIHFILLVSLILLLINIILQYKKAEK